jgi:hypothetical protein
MGVSLIVVVSCGHYLGRCTVCLVRQRSSAYFDLSICLQPVCLSPVCLSLFCRSDWLANPIACASFPRLTPLPPSVDSLDSELWYRFGAELLLWLLVAPLGRWAVFSAAFHHVECAPRVISSLTAESPTIRSFKHLWCRYRDSRHPCPAREGDS